MKDNFKKILSIEEQIEHLENKGILFNIVSKDEAKIYLHDNNNFFKMTAYRKNFPKHPGGINEGKYIDLDFGMLKDLSIIDMHIRYLFIHMCLDIEHFIKIKLIKSIEEGKNDGYKIVSDYFAYLKKVDINQYEKLKHEIERNRQNPYCDGLIERYCKGNIKQYSNKIPIWAFVEIISFGTLIHLVKFYGDQIDNEELKQDYYSLMRIKQLRNACAHNNCIINDLNKLNKSNKNHKLDLRIYRNLNKIKKNIRDKQFGNENVRQIITMVYVHNSLVSSDDVKKHTKEQLRTLMSRIFRNETYYTNNEMLISTFNFLKDSIDILYQI